LRCRDSPKIGVLHQHLHEKLKSGLDLNLARVKCLTLLISSLLRHRTVNLTILATETLSGAKNESSYRRFQNFFLKCSLSCPAIGRLILAKIPKPSNGWVLSMDRTNWKYGKRHINILTIGVVVNKVAIPINQTLRCVAQNDACRRDPSPNHGPGIWRRRVVEVA